MNTNLKEPEQIHVRINRVVRALGIAAFFLVLASLAGQLAVRVFGYRGSRVFIHLFNVDAEHNIPTYFSMILLLAAAFLLGVTAAAERTRKSPDVPYWVILAAGFLFMSVDEVAVLHEKLIEPVKRLGNGLGHGFFYYSWVIPGLVVVLIVGLVFFRFLSRLEPKTRFAFLAAGAVYLTGTIGFEMIAGRHADLHGTRNLVYALLATVEESLEMAGVILFIRALLVRLADRYGEITFRFEKNRPNAVPDGG